VLSMRRGEAIEGRRLDFPPLPTHISPLPSLARSHAPIPRATDAHTRTHAMAGRYPDPDDGGDDGGDTAPPAQRARPDDDPPPPVSVCGLEVGLLDVGRVVALNGYPEACRRLAFVSCSFYLERDLLMATKRVRYGGKRRTRLMSLSRQGDAERVSFLLKVHAEVKAADAWGWTPLHIASGEGHESVVRLLLDKGADVRAATFFGAMPLRWASAEGHAPIVRFLLVWGTDVGARKTDDWTPLHIACRQGHESVVRLLLDRGADASAATLFGATALHYASMSGHAAVVALLRKAGAV
jgi:hypothetical protein